MKKNVIIAIFVFILIMCLTAQKLNSDGKDKTSKSLSMRKILQLGFKKEQVFTKLNIHPTIYLALNEKYELDDYGYKSSNDSVLKIDGKNITANKLGKTTLNKNNSIYEVVVTDVIVYPKIDDGSKQEIPCGYYTQEMNEYLDEILKAKVMDKGWGTRAGAVEAARFLLLQFPYKLHYFMENGRLPWAEGEGRYHHYGLYLHLYKVDKDGMAGKQVTGPAPWGCWIFNNTSELTQRNSLDCSGFVTWAIYNGGNEIGDIGAGPSPNVLDCSDLGTNYQINYETLDNCRPGDLFAEDGHIAIMVGRKDDLIYIAESNTYINVRCKGWTYDELINSKFYAWVDMDEFYQYKDGKLTDYWE